MVGVEWKASRLTGTLYLVAFCLFGSVLIFGGSNTSFLSDSSWWQIILGIIILTLAIMAFVRTLSYLINPTALSADSRGIKVRGKHFIPWNDILSISKNIRGKHSLEIKKDLKKYNISKGFKSAFSVEYYIIKDTYSISVSCPKKRANMTETEFYQSLQEFYKKQFNKELAQSNLAEQLNDK